MPNVRPLNKKYGLSKYRFAELRNFCLQYHEWKDELTYKNSTVKSVEITDMPFGGSGNSNATCDLAVRRVELQRKCELVERTAIETDPELYQYIIKSATNEDITYAYLSCTMEIPCSHNTWYDRRRKFYWLLDKKM